MALTLVTAGCVTGERPTLESQPEVDDPAAAVVIDRLGRVGTEPFTAQYDIIPTTTGQVTKATIEQADGRRRITIGDVVYRTDGAGAQTCSGAGVDCVDGLDDARISDLNLTHRFWSDAFATRLTVDSNRNIGFSEGRTDTIAGRSAVCAEVPLAGGTATYCALDEGVLGRYFGGDVSIELTSFEPAADLSTDPNSAG